MTKCSECGDEHCHGCKHIPRGRVYVGVSDEELFHRYLPAIIGWQAINDPAHTKFLEDAVDQMRNLVTLYREVFPDGSGKMSEEILTNASTEEERREVRPGRPE